jgi:hypothetical protein
MAISLPVVGTINWMSLVFGLLLGAFILPWIRAKIGM